MSITKVMNLVPTVMAGADETYIAESLTEATQKYKDDLPSAELLDQELTRWIHYWQRQPLPLPSSCYETLQKCDRHIFPNVYSLLKLLCIPFPLLLVSVNVWVACFVALTTT